MRRCDSVFVLVAVCIPAWVHASLLVPAYNSYPSATAKVYLDFDGDFTATWGTHSPGTTPAYDIDNDPATFSQQELDNIHEIFMRVAEKYSPFNINVTTVDPGVYNNFEALRVVIGGDGAWVGQVAGGIAMYDSFVNSDPNTVFVFPKNLGNGTPKYVAEIAAHEAGHGFGLRHQSLYTSFFRTTEYNPGDEFKAPIMGNSLHSERGLWWYGTSTGHLTFQDDMAVIANTAPEANGFGYRPDDHGNTPETATPLFTDEFLSILPMPGVIEQTTDMDFFSFSTPGGIAHLYADVAPFGPMLDLSLSLYDELGTLMEMQATSSLGESIIRLLDPGLYFLAVSSAGNYGDVGQYTVHGSLIPEPAGAVLLLLSLALLGVRQRRHRSSTPVSTARSNTV